ncbi:MAG: hypothetical protein U0794_02255 [Isosphaeraceae bacterium]
MDILRGRVAVLAFAIPVFLGGMAFAAGRLDRYYAICQQHNPAWTGPYRSSQDQARADARAHERQYPGHSADVLSGLE